MISVEGDMSLQQTKMQTDVELVVAALEEAQRLLASYENPCVNRTRDDIIAMVEYIICDPSVTRAMVRQKMRSRLKLVGQDLARERVMNAGDETSGRGTS